MKANFTRKSKRPFYYKGRIYYPRLVDAEKRCRKDEKICKTGNYFIIKKKSLNTKKR